MNQTIPSILFVDDEENILKSLKRLLNDEDWNCHFAGSGQEALALLAKQPVDVILSDVVMPEMDGIQLLAEAKRLYPGMIRIFLTGFAKQEKVSRALSEGFTQQIIPKPWIDQELKEIIRSALRQSRQQKSRNPEFQAMINSIPLLPPLPESYSQVKGCITEDDVDIEKMAAIISKDVAISSALLHWANSALFGQRYQVDTIKKAIVVLGTDIVENLILSESIHRSIASNLPKIPGFDLREFTRHSIAVAVISRLLIRTLSSSNTDQQDRAFIAGLLHDMGKLAAASFFTEKFAEAIRQAEEENCFLAEKETEIIGANHAELGSFLAEWWALPPFIVNAIHWHHTPALTPIEQDVVYAVHVANLLSYQFDFGSNGDTRPREVSKPCWDRFYLTEEGVEILQFETEKILRLLLG
jgi:HD-like signal output (HDOD) protein/CheY-like chemotaxis protein